MDIDIWASHADDFSIEVNSFTEEPKDVWYTVVLGTRPSRVKFYITHEQLRELTGKCVTAMVDAKPEDDFYRGPIEATYEPTELGKAAM